MTGTKLIMTFPVTATSHLLSEYRARGGYATLERVLRTMRPEEVTKEVAASGILGHGGAAFPAGRKWGVIKLNDGQPHFLCANADEGEPGTFKDRWILENAPHLLLESMLISSYALQVRNAFVYIRGEFDLPYRRLAVAVEEAYAAGLFGERILGTDFSCDIVIYRGAGSYVCGEASALITSIEGKKGYPRNRPPRLTVRGLYQQPTVINNVETLSNVAAIVNLGGEGFRKIGTAKSPGTQLVSISGHIERPGVYEVEYGYPLAKFIYEDCGGALGGGKVKCIVPGGISTKVLTAAEIEPVTYDHASLAAAGSGVGSGGMVVIAEGTCMVAAASAAALLSPRIVRPVHAVPRRHGLDAPHHRPHRRRRREDGRHRPVDPHLQGQRRHDDLRHGRRRGLRHAGHHRQVSRRVRILHRAQAFAPRWAARSRDRRPQGRRQRRPPPGGSKSFLGRSGE